MTQEELSIKRDRMLYTKDKTSANLVILSIVFDCLYFVSLYSTDVGSYYYNWVIGASVVYNLLFLLGAFLCSEGVKNRKTGYTGLLLVLGVMQFVRMAYLPTKAHAAVVEVSGQQLQAMGDGQYIYVLACLAASGACVIAAMVISYINNKSLAEHIRTLENKPA